MHTSHDRCAAAQHFWHTNQAPSTGQQCLLVWRGSDCQRSASGRRPLQAWFSHTASRGTHHRAQSAAAAVAGKWAHCPVETAYSLFGGKNFHGCSPERDGKISMESLPMASFGRNSCFPRARSPVYTIAERSPAQEGCGPGCEEKRRIRALTFGDGFAPGRV